MTTAYSVFIIAIPIILVIMFAIAMRNKQSIVSIIRRMFGITCAPNTPNIRYEVATVLNKQSGATGIISTCLYATSNCISDDFESKYVCPIYKSIKDAKDAFPTWSYRIYLDPRLLKLLAMHIEKLVAAGAEIHVMNMPSKGHSGSMWRYLPAEEDLPFLAMDSDDDVFIKYGCNWITHVKSWLESDRPFFQMRAYLYSMFIPIMGKYWGGKARSIPNISEIINQYTDDWYGCDEAMLTKVVYPLFKRDGVYIVNNWYEYSMLFTIIVFIVCAIVLIVNR